ncbi:MAG: nucleotidyl transferase AbiEii/AbiGii toxin family protein [Pirellulales bacterium]
MAKEFTSATAFRTSLEQRLKQKAAERNIPLNTLRLKVVIERLLARLFFTDRPAWLLKGGYAMDLRYRPKARTTKDIDLTVPHAALETRHPLDAVRDAMQEAAELDLKDFFVFRIGQPRMELQGAPLGGARFLVTSLLAGKVFAKFHVDVGIGDPLVEPSEELIGEDFLAFAGVAPAKVLVISKAQQFAEKIHAYTLERQGRENTRTKDLVDLVLLVTRDPPRKESVLKAIDMTFNARKTHTVPRSLSEPPAAWSRPFAAMATEAALESADLMVAFRIVEDFWRSELGYR